MCFCYELSVESGSKVTLYLSCILLKRSSSFRKASFALAIVFSLSIGLLILLKLLLVHLAPFTMNDSSAFGDDDICDRF